MGSADGRGDEGVGSNWSGGGHRSMELPPYVTLMEGMDVFFVITTIFRSWSINFPSAKFHSLQLASTRICQYHYTEF